MPGRKGLAVSPEGNGKENGAWQLMPGANLWSIDGKDHGDLPPFLVLDRRHFIVATASGDFMFSRNFAKGGRGLILF